LENKLLEYGKVGLRTLVLCKRIIDI